MEPWAPLVFEFRGSARQSHRSEDKNSESEWGYDAAQIMNERCGEICDSIRADLKRSLPPGIEVSVEIEYFPGSLEWLGVVTIMDWAARIADNISLGEYIARAIRSVVNRVNRRFLRRWGGPGLGDRRMNFETEAHQLGRKVLPEPAGRTTTAAGQGFPVDLRVLLYMNTALLLLVLVVLAVLASELL